MLRHEVQIYTILNRSAESFYSDVIRDFIQLCAQGAYPDIRRYFIKLHNAQFHAAYSDIVRNFIQFLNIVQRACLDSFMQHQTNV